MLNNKDPDILLLLSYIEKTFGFKGSIRHWEDERKIPLLLKEQYSFYLLRLLDSDNLIFIENRENGNTPAVISKHCKMLTNYWSKGIIYVKNTVSSTDRTRLIQAKIPFIIPDKQLYLPFMGMDFKEIFPPEKRKTGKLSPSAQLLVLGKLYKRDWTGKSPFEISHNLHISNMSVGRAFSELELHHIASVHTLGKEKVLEFHLSGFDLWNTALPILRSPVTSTKTFPFQESNNLVLAGESALSKYSMLNEPHMTTFAIFNRSKDILIHPNIDNPNEDMIIQKWAYDPRTFSKNGVADPLSIYLEFKESEDERLKQALEGLIKDIQW
ncbi:hypothetical protein [Sphaerochaeta sp. S2]|uniref:hypothetical protein n=1 Tax=Sphaerochaeta sp. S2 TaxID=2798868 RepID=UPI0018EA08FF|nr:hypothetical protein [Sphaerochaeta sp. S2]MBJ2356586.1 hypothetical protein [Sphaerochaeta sp. S2]